MKNVVTVVFPALALALVTGCITDGTHDKLMKEAVNPLKEDIANLNKEKADLTAKVNGLDKNLADSNAKLSECSSSVAETKKQLEQRTNSYDQLTKSLQSEIKKGQIELTNLKGKLSVKMADKILFASGSAVVGKDGKEVLNKIAAALKDITDKRVMVEGHTDNVKPGSKSIFKDNWELSLSRALAVVRILQDSGLDPARLEAAGMGEFQPLASNDTEEGRSLNRRIELDLLPLEANNVQAPATPAPAAK